MIENDYFVFHEEKNYVSEQWKMINPRVSLSWITVVTRKHTTGNVLLQSYSSFIGIL